MKMKLENILTINETMKSIIDNPDLKIDPLFKFKLLGIMKSIETHVANFEIIRNEKIREYGTENEDGNISISADDKETIQKFSDELNELLKTDIDVNFAKLKANDVFDKGLPAVYLVNLYSIIEE